MSEREGGREKGKVGVRDGERGGDGERGRERVKKRTNNHAGADVAELGFLAVVVLELVRPVIGDSAGLGSQRLLPPLLLNLLVVDK